MKLSKEQIEELYTFVRKKGIEYIDLQDEFVDHLANGIETQWEENSTLRFEDALQKEYKKFGIFGFDDVLVERTKMIEIKGCKLFFSDVLSYLKLPKIILSVFCFYLVLSLIDMNPAVKLYVILIISFMSIYIPVRTLYWKIKFNKSKIKYITIIRYLTMLQLCSSLTGLWFWGVIIQPETFFNTMVNSPPYLLSSILVLEVLMFLIQTTLITQLKGKLEYS